jgi:4-amino-4-deoxy-L-arabinose transferase-like glycosyltransferase
MLARHPRLALVLLCLALWLPGLAAVPPTDRDESRFAQATRQMLETGDYVRIMNGTVPRNKKPIGIHWLQAPFAAAAQAAGIASQNPVWPYRLPSLLGAMAAVLATAAIGRTLLGTPQAGLLAGAMLAGCILLTAEAHIAKTDAALTGATTVAMIVMARAWVAAPIGRGMAALFWVALAAGILIKGPITPAVLGLTATAASLATRRIGWLAPLRPAWGIPLLLLLIAPWFAAIGIATHGAFFADALGGDLGRKLAGGEETHGAPPGYHLLLLPLLCFPATAPILRGLHAAAHRWRQPATTFLLAWLVPAWLMFEAAPTKLPHYPLPLYPALCLLAAAWLTNPLPAPAWFNRACRTLAALAALTLGSAALLLPVILHASPWLGVPASLLAIPAGVYAWRERPLRAALAAVPLYAALLQFELPRLPMLWIAPRAEAALHAAWPDAPSTGADILVTGYAEPSLMFLAGTRLRMLPTGTMAAREWLKPPHAAVFVADAELPQFLAEAARLGAKPTPAASIDGIDTGRGKPVRLTLYVR